MAPEVFFCEADTTMNYDYRVDLWSFGITLIEMAEMDPPYHEMRPERVGAKIRQALPPTLKEVQRWSDDFSQFLSCCLKRDPNERFTADQLQKHSFLSNVKTLHQSILYLLEEFKTTPVVEVMEDETIAVDDQQNEGSDSSFSDEEANENPLQSPVIPQPQSNESTSINPSNESLKNNIPSSNVSHSPDQTPPSSLNSTQEFPVQPSPKIIIERLTPPSPMVNDHSMEQPIPMRNHIEIDRLQLEDLVERTLNKTCERYYNEILEEVLQSDCEQPSIPEVILAVITELTSDDQHLNSYYSHVRQSVENDQVCQLRRTTRRSRGE